MKLWENRLNSGDEVPELFYYPAKEKKSDVTLLIFPGGAYHSCAYHESFGMAEYFSNLGYNSFTCIYRVQPYHFPLQLLDARRAIRTIRYNAEKYGIDKSKIVVIGSSAGGNLCALLSTYKEPIEYEGVDDIDKEDFMPNAQVLCYPAISFYDSYIRYCYENLCGKDKLDELIPVLSPEKHVTADTPPTFIWQCADDGCVGMFHSCDYAKALASAKVPVELHIFPFGGHGIGTAPDSPHVAQWINLLINWIDMTFPEDKK